MAHHVRAFPRDLERAAPVLVPLHGHGQVHGLGLQELNVGEPLGVALLVRLDGDLVHGAALAENRVELLWGRLKVWGMRDRNNANREFSYSVGCLN